MELELTLQQGVLFPMPRHLQVNGDVFHQCGGAGSRFTFAGEPQAAIGWVRFLADASFTSLLPDVIFLNARAYRRRCEHVYCPVDATPGEIERFFDATAEKYEATIDRQLNRCVLRRMLSAAARVDVRGGGEPLRVLDFGCGSGLAWDEYAARAVSAVRERALDLYGCDISSEMVRLCHRRGYYNAQKCSYGKTAFSSGMFDVVMSAFVVHYCVDDKPLRELVRVLKPGGLLLISLPARESASKEYYVQRLREILNGGQVVRGSAWKIVTDEKVRSIPIIATARSSRRTPGEELARWNNCVGEVGGQPSYSTGRGRGTNGLAPWRAD